MPKPPLAQSPAASPIPADALTQHLVIVGKTGSGKSYAARGLVESILDRGQRVCVIDPTGVWWGLRAPGDSSADSSADGSPDGAGRDGYPVVIFGGEHADVPLSPHAGQALAELIAGRNIPCVVDLSEMLIGDRHTFMTDFAAALYHHNRAPLYLVIDEADEFCPQNPLPETRRMLHQVDRIVRRGRVRGFRVTMITQRPAVLHKNVLTQANTLIAMQLTAPQDRKAVEAWIEGQADRDHGREVLATLPRLKVGEGWVWAPIFDVLTRATFPRIRTYDSSRTPEDGETITEPARLASVDLTEITRLLATAEVEAKDNDPTVLKRRIAELERELSARAGSRLKAATPAVQVETRVERVEIPVVKPEQISVLRDMVNKLGDTLASTLGQFNATLDKIATAQAAAQVAAQANLAQRAHSPQPRQPRLPAAPAHQAPPAFARVVAGTDIPKAERAILAVLGLYPDGRTKRQLAIQTGYAVAGGGFNNALGSLNTQGLITRVGDLVRITDAGLQASGSFEPLPTGAGLREYWMTQLSKAERAVLQVLADTWPNALPKTVVAERAGYEANGGGFNNAIGRLRTLELIAGGTRGAPIHASDELFD